MSILSSYLYPKHLTIKSLQSVEIDGFGGKLTFILLSIIFSFNILS
jgi:hypothetical protein